MSFGAARRLGLLFVIALAVGLIGPAGSVAARSGAKLTVSPQPNTPDASPETQISVLGVPRQGIRSVQVSGQASGPHVGHLRSYSHHRGASFVLDQPLAQGESVSVAIRIEGRKPIRFGFTVARLGAKLPRSNLPSTQPDKLDHFVTEPGLTPPKITVNKSSKRAQGQRRRPPHAAALAGRPSGEQQHRDDQSRRSRRPDDRRRRREPRLVQAARPAGGGRESPAAAIPRPEGADLVGGDRDSVRVRGGRRRDRQSRLQRDPCGARRQRLPDGPARVRAHPRRRRPLHDLPADPRPPARARPGGRSRRCSTRSSRRSTSRPGLVVWEWHSYGHIPLETSQATPQNSASYDAFHINSIQALKKDRVLISARDTSGDLRDRPGERAGSSGRSAARGPTSASAPAPSSTSSTTPACCATGESACSTTGPARRSSTPSRAG